MKYNVKKVVNMQKALIFGGMLCLVNACINPKSWTKWDIKQTNKKYTDYYVYVYRYLNVIESADTNEIVIKDLVDNKKRVLKPNEQAIYIETGRLYHGDWRRFFQPIQTKDIQNVLHPGDTVAVQIDTWYVTGFPSGSGLERYIAEESKGIPASWTAAQSAKEIYQDTNVVPMVASKDPRTVVTLYVPNMGVLAVNKQKQK